MKTSMTEFEQSPQRRRTIVAMTPTKPVATYRFPCTIDSSPSMTYDSMLGELSVASENVTATDFLTCPHVEFADGVQSQRLLQSLGRVADLQQAFRHAEALVVEVWMTPSFSPQVASAPIVSVAQPHSPTSHHQQRHFGDCEGVQFSLQQVGNQLQVRYKDYYEYLMPLDDDDDSDVDVYACRVLTITDVKLKYQDLNHIVVLWKESASVIQIYINGVESAQSIYMDLGYNHDDDDDFAESPIFGYDLQSWDPTYTLQLFSNHMVGGVLYGGLIHKVSIFSNDLLPHDVQTMYEEGLEERKQEFIFDPNEPLHVIAAALPAENITVVQGLSTSIPIGGDMNTSSPFWDLMVEFISLPKFGYLMSLNTDIVRRVGDRIIVDGGLTRTHVMYWQAEEDYFSVPKYSFNGTRLPHGNESFSYRLVVVNRDDPDQLFGWSEPVEQGITVIHANHEPKLYSPNQVVLPAAQNTKDYERPFATLGDVILQDEADYNINKVRVDLWCRNGTLSIANAKTRDLADFASCMQRPAGLLSTAYPWQCHGDGLKDRNMTFIATPDEASEILSNIQYDAFYWEQEDTITLKVFDGSGGSCLSEEDHLQGRYHPMEYKTVHDGCFEVVKRIKVPPVSQPKNPNPYVGLRGYLYEIFVDLKDFGQADFIFWGVALLLLILLCCLAKCLFNCCFACLRRRSEAVIHIEDYPASRMTTVKHISRDEHVHECDAV
jgi:hypothetical protein